MSGGWLQVVIAASYLVAATLFLLGLQRMASPRTARSGIQWAGAGNAAGGYVVTERMLEMFKSSRKPSGDDK